MYYILMHRGKWYVVLDKNENELYQSEQLYDATLVYLLLSGGKLLDSERLRAMMLINGGGTSGTERVPKGMEKTKQGKDERVPEERSHSAGYPGD